MTAYFLILWFVNAPFQMIPMPDMATCQAMERQARHSSSTPALVRTKCQKIENGNVTEGSLTGGSPAKP